ncbi:hypothetical protein [Saliphagus sp. LR7]|uniref:hypothetical protein n=1 Tax=Saliphagus sp. LR7 TaxID=2282654 RepID=UPI000DF775BC|nr:hypothetical protein [Saliphagus sp. LR7]
MSTTERHPTLAPFLAAPARGLLLSVAPLALAAAQLANGYANDLPAAVAVGFAAAMVAFAVVATRHHAAEWRLNRLEGTFGE